MGAGFGGIAAAIELRRHGFDGHDRARAGAGHRRDVALQRLPGLRLRRAEPPVLVLVRAAPALVAAVLAAGGDPRGIWRRWRGITASIGSCGPASTSCRARWDDGVVEWTVAAPTGAAGGRTRSSSPPGSCTSRRSRGRGRRRVRGRELPLGALGSRLRPAGKRVAVIGTGASAVQFVPEVAEQAARLYVFQRTGNWFLPRRNRPTRRWCGRSIQHVPGVQAFRRRFIYYYAETLTLMIRNPRTVGRVGRLRSALFMRWQLRDPEVRRKRMARLHVRLQARSCSARATCRRSSGRTSSSSPSRSRG